MVAAEVAYGFAETVMRERMQIAPLWQPRAEQTPPVGEWRTWLFLAGRGAGKTRAAAEYVRQMAGMPGSPMQRVALVGPTAADVRDVMVEGESGVLAVCQRYGIYPIYQPSRRRVLFPHGSMAYLYSAEEPDRLRGPQHDGAWCDEIAAWAYPETWDMLQLGLRLGDAPRVVATTTPRPVSLVRQLVAQVGDGVALTRGRTRDNAANLAPGFLSAIEGRYAGTRLGRQELDGELLDDIEGALWTWALLDAHRVSESPELRRIVVAIDPAATSRDDSNETGIIVAGLGDDDHAYVLADYSGRYTPAGWAQRAVQAFDEWDADAVVIETNQGGEMATSTLRSARHRLPIRPVHASKGKVARAEPVSALYEQGRVHHVGGHAALEDQLTGYVAGGVSPDRLDALVWAITDLMPQRPVARVAIL